MRRPATWLPIHWLGCYLHKCPRPACADTSTCYTPSPRPWQLISITRAPEAELQIRNHACTRCADAVQPLMDLGLFAAVPLYTAARGTWSGQVAASHARAPRERAHVGRHAVVAQRLRLHDALHVGAPAVLARDQYARRVHRPLAHHDLWHRYCLWRKHMSDVVHCAAQRESIMTPMQVHVKRWS